MKSTKAKKATKKIYKVEYADKEWNFLSSKIIEAANDFEAWQMANEITKRYYGDILDLYLHRQ